MGQLDKKLSNVRKYKNIHKVLNAILKDNEKEILALNRDQMYEEGVIDVNNPRNILDYAPSTIKQKKRRARYKRTDHITLKWTGDFHKSLSIKYEPEQITIISKKLPWSGFLDGRFANALGLTEDSKNELRQLVKSDLILGFKHALQEA